MGRKESEVIRKHFTSVDNKNFICNIGNCKQNLKCNNVYNMDRHLKTKHNDTYTLVKLEIEKINEINSKIKVAV